MSKPIFVIVSLVVLYGNMVICSAQAPQIEQTAKEEATGQSKEPWKGKNLPPDAVGDVSNEMNNSWHGHLISANSVAACKNYSHCFDFLNKYEKTTALSARSRAKGYLLYANDKWYTLDKHGNDLAVKAIQKSIKSKGFYVAVNGKLKGNIIIVDNLVEIIGTPGWKASAPTKLDDSKLHPVDKVQGHLLDE